jgi:hypothetical protein
MQIDMAAWLKMHEGQMLFDSRDQDAAMSDIEYFIISWEVCFWSKGFDNFHLNY